MEKGIIFEERYSDTLFDALSIISVAKTIV